MRANNFIRGATIALLLGSPTVSSWAETPNNRFGFTGPEIFPIDNAIGLLHAADLDGDGLKDLIVVNNSRSKINLLYNQTEKTNPAPGLRSLARRELNELPPDARFRVDSIASEKRIAAMVVADLNSDGRPDIAFYGEPKELVVLYNEGAGGWSVPKRWPIEDGQLSQNAMTAGDLNSDGRSDLVLLAENHAYAFLQQEDHSLGEPEKIPIASPVKSLMVLDIDGDGRNDLLFVNWESQTPFRFRLQNATGQFDPEVFCSLPPIRSYWADTLEPNQKTFVITIAQQSGRAQISQFTRKPSEVLSGSFRQGQLSVLPLPKTDKARRGLQWADVNGDGRPDLLAAEPESGKLTVYFQLAGGTLAAPRSFPSLAGVSDIAVADWDGDGQPEIFLLSADERQIGVARFDGQQRLPFPVLIPVDGKPLAMAVAPLAAGALPALAVLVDQDGRRSLTTRSADGSGRTQKLSENFKSNPVTLAIHDVNQDGLPDLLALIPYEKVKLLIQTAGNEYEEQDVAPPGGVDVAQPWFSTADVDGDGRSELLLAQRNFVRAVVLRPENSGRPSDKPTWVFQVKDQINGAASNSRLAGAAAVPQGTNAVPSLFLLDAERKALTLCERDAAGVWQVIRNLPLPVWEFGAVQPLVQHPSTPNAVTLLGLNAVAILPLAGEVWEFSALDSYETPIKDGYLNDVISGDLNNDGRKDLVFMETGKNHLDLVIFDANHKLVPADRWKVFEQRTFRSRGGELPEPREALVADLTGDGKSDLAVVVHDRVLVYPQE